MDMPPHVVTNTRPSSVSETEHTVPSTLHSSTRTEVMANNGLNLVAGSSSYVNISGALKKRGYHSSDSDNTDDEKQRRKKSNTIPADRPTASAPSCMSKHQWQQALLDDKWVDTAEPARVKCKGCIKWIALRTEPTRQFELNNWMLHRHKCPKITGEGNKRVSLGQQTPSVSRPVRSSLPSIVQHIYLHQPTGMRTLASYFGGPAGSGEKDLKGQMQNSTTPKCQGFDHNDDERGCKHYKTVKVKSNPLVLAHFPMVSGTTSRSLTSESSMLAPAHAPCQHLRGPKYMEYILRTQTRLLGGISHELRARISRQLFPYKPFPELKNSKGANSMKVELEEIPWETNQNLKEKSWTADEKRKLDESLLAWARWEVDYTNGFIRSAQCKHKTSNKSGICDACEELAEKDEAFKHAIRRKTKESELPEEDQHQIQLAREKFTPNTFHSTDGHALQDKLKDPLVFKIFKMLERGSPAECFIELYEAARNGKLAGHTTFKQLCDVFTDRFHRINSDNPNLKFGIRYPEAYLNFMILLRSHGGNSMRQYSILTSQLGGPSSQQLRTLVAKCPDALRNPSLVYENIARVKWLVDVVQYGGPVSVGGDCTKVEVMDDIDNIIDNIQKAKAEAKQVCAILIKILLPQYPPQVVALLPTTGNDDASKIHSQLMQLIDMAARLDLPIISAAADGAASELRSQWMMDQEGSTVAKPFTYTNVRYGIHLQAPVFKTGPLVSITDPPHACKTCWNQPQHGTHTASLGIGYLVNKSFIDLQKIEGSGLLKRDVEDVDKQDDGAARRIFHDVALYAATEPVSSLPSSTATVATVTAHCTMGEQRKIREGFEGVFVYLLIFGM
ncbi:hypothetical protein BDN67DRAFT_984506 [Paxillus ammoniavirescens]|nr:hypothetical protein BDN67DRAFT_984506 [Paxillus ammoniavirescens]